jgi:hypothetical protein
VQIARNLSDRTKEIIRPLPIADKKCDLLLLMRLPRESQEAIAELLGAGAAKSVLKAQRALNAGAVVLDATPNTQQSASGQASDPRSPRVELDREDQDTLLHSVIVRFKQSSAIAQGQIAGRPAADVMAERLAALPRPEVVLLRALVMGQGQEAAASWVAAVRADVQNGVHPFDGVKRPDCHGDSADAPDGQFASGNDQAQTSAFPVLAAHLSAGDTACSEGRCRSAAVMAVQSDDGADTEMRADGDQLHLPWS